MGLDLEITAGEAVVGDFSLDLLAKDLGTGRPVVIENQFGTTNHDHLGKLITFSLLVLAKLARVLGVKLGALVEDD